MSGVRPGTPLTTATTMLFNSFTFAAFVAVVFVLYYLQPLKRHQVLVLIAGSFVFYAWNYPALLLLLICSILINAGSSYAVKFGPERNRKLWAAGGIAANLALLSFFKYGRLLTQTLQPILHGSDHVLTSIASIPLPIGISFYTFEGISLLVDVFRSSGPRDPNKPTATLAVPAGFREHLTKTALFIAFFPHLAAGPILKARHFYPQIVPKQLADIPWLTVVRTLILGYFLKMVVADNLKDYTFWIAYPYFLSHNTVTLLVLLFGFSMQIFADFAGYSLIAIGVALMFGYRLPDNFDFPYISQSLSEFWRRWHISLSTWLRDYLYFPLGGNRMGRARTYVNLMIVMFLGGLWHGAAWSFAVWGLYHGAGLAFERWMGLRIAAEPNSVTVSQPTLKSQVLTALRMMGVFSFVTLGWLLFKLTNFHEALQYLAAIPQNRHVPLNPMLVLPVLLYAAPVVLYHLSYLAKHSSRARSLQARIASSPWTYALMLYFICTNNGSSNAFIYFQF